jgi:hypothetical protein
MATAFYPSRAVVPIVCYADPKGSVTSSLGIHRYITVNLYFEVYLFFHYRNNVLLKKIEELCNW